MQIKTMQIKCTCSFSQAAVEDGGGAGPGVRWPRPSPRPPGGHRSQAGAAGLEGGSGAL